MLRNEWEELLHYISLHEEYADQLRVGSLNYDKLIRSLSDEMLWTQSISRDSLDVLLKLLQQSGTYQEQVFHRICSDIYMSEINGREEVYKEVASAIIEGMPRDARKPLQWVIGDALAHFITGATFDETAIRLRAAGFAQALDIMESTFRMLGAEPND